MIMSSVRWSASNPMITNGTAAAETWRSQLGAAGPARGPGGPCGPGGRGSGGPGGPGACPGGIPERVTGKRFLTYYRGAWHPHIQLFSLPVTDQDRARDFYVDTLGFELVADTTMGPDKRWVQVRPPGAQTSITLVTWFPTMPAGAVKGTVLETGDLDGDVTALRARGVVIELASRRRPGDGS